MADLLSKKKKVIGLIITLNRKLYCTFATILELFRAILFALKASARSHTTLHCLFCAKKMPFQLWLDKKIVEAHQSKRLSFDVSPHYNP